MSFSPLGWLQRITFDGERRLNSLYLQGMSCLEQGDPGSAIPALERACEEFGVVGEPFVMLALAQRWMEEPDAARKTAAKGRELLCDWGTPWHKRFSMDEWCRLANVLEEGGTTQEITKALRGLFGVHDQGRKDACLEPRDFSLGTSEQAAVYRFFSYLKTINKERSKSAVKWYPGLRRKPWYDPRDFSVARRLEQAYAEIRSEAERVAPSSYYEEAEEIGRVGNWQVCMFYEQRRRDDYICGQCPTIASILDSDPCVRRSSGLIYLSKMASRTHIAPHQAGTNMRLRCHLAISIPTGDCAIRVGDRVRQWDEGKCMVFDDTFEHEVWNRTDQERLVLLIDLWHPDLSDFEREALETVNWLGLWQADSLLATWERNERQRETEGKRALAQRSHVNLRPNW